MMMKNCCTHIFFAKFNCLINSKSRRSVFYSSFIACLTVFFASLAAASLPTTAVKSTASSPPMNAVEATSTPNGGWLAVDKKTLKLIARDGKEISSFSIRGKHLDARVETHLGLNRMTVALLDANTNQPILMYATNTELTLAPPLLAPDFSIEASCMYKDAQGNLQLFLLGKNGIAENWLLGDESHKRIRKMALPANAEKCVVDDQLRILYVSEPDVGLWAYDISREAITNRALVAARPPHGNLAEDVIDMAVIQNGIATLQEGRAYAYLAPTTLGSLDLRRKWVSASLSTNKLNNGYTQIISNTQSATTLWAKAKTNWTAIQLQPSLKPTAPALSQPNLPIITPLIQTKPVTSFGDAADDPAIWLHPTDSSRSLVIATNKKQGLLAYDLEGNERQFLPVGRINNVDVRQKITLGGVAMDIAVATQRDEKAIVVFSFNADGVLKEETRLKTALNDIYGVCAGMSREGQLDIFANDKDGRFIQVRASRNDNKWSSEVVRQFAVDSQPEGCVVDESQSLIFIGEEKRGVWVLSSRADQPTTKKMVLAVGDMLSADVEGLAMYQNGTNSYLVISSQGNDSYVVTDAKQPYRVRGAFRIGINRTLGIDGTSETDGIEVTSASLGGAFKRGMLVVQDGYKLMPSGAQNFKYVPWEAIATALKLE